METPKAKQSENLDSPLRFAKDILRYAPAKIFPAMIGLLWSFIFTRIFPPEQYGIYGLVTALVIPLATVLTQWAAQPIGRFYAEYKEKNLEAVYLKIVNQLVFFIFIIMNIIFTGFLLYAGLFKPANFLIMLGALISLVATSFTLLLTPILPASLDAVNFRKLEILRPVARVSIALLLVFTVGENIAMLVWADAMASLVFLIPLYRIVSIKLRDKKQIEKVVNYKKDLIRFTSYGFPMMIWFFSGQLLNVGDRFIIEYFVGSEAVGIYTANYNVIFGIAGLLNAPITLAAFPLIMKLWAMGQKEKLPQVMTKMTFIYGVLALVMFGGTFIVQKPLIQLLLGEAYLEGYIILFPVVGGIILWQASMLGHKGMELYERTPVMVRWVGLAAIANVALNIIFIPVYGYQAAAWTTLISYFIYTFLIWNSSKDYIPWNIPGKALLPYVLFIIIGVSVANIVHIEYPLLNLLVRGSLYVLIVGIGVAILNKDKLKNRGGK